MSKYIRKYVCQYIYSLKLLYRSKSKDEERDRLIYRIYEARIRMILLRIGIAAFITFIVYIIYLVRHALETFMNDLPYLILEAILLQFLINTPFQIIQFGVFNSGSDSEFEATDEKDLNYLSDCGQAN